MIVRLTEEAVETNFSIVSAKEALLRHPNFLTHVLEHLRSTKVPVYSSNSWQTLPEVIHPLLWAAMFGEKVKQP
jgi:hypothetical protein